MPAPHHSVFYRLDALPAAQRTASKHWRHSLSYCRNILCYLNKRVFSFIRQLTMWHCLRVLLSAGHEAIKWYLLATKPTAANPPQRHATTKWWDDEDRRVDRQTDRCSTVSLLCILHQQGRNQNNSCCMSSTWGVNTIQNLKTTLTSKSTS